MALIRRAAGDTAAVAARSQHARLLVRGAVDRAPATDGCAHLVIECLGVDVVLLLDDLVCGREIAVPTTRAPPDRVGAR